MDTPTGQRKLTYRTDNMKQTAIFCKKEESFCRDSQMRVNLMQFFATRTLQPLTANLTF